MMINQYPAKNYNFHAFFLFTNIIIDPSSVSATSKALIANLAFKSSPRPSFIKIKNKTSCS